MAFTSRARGNPVLHTDVNQYAQYFAATNSQAVSRAGDSASAYADSLAQRDTTNGYILRAGYGAAGSETWLLDITKTRSIVTNFADKGGQAHNVLAYGATGDGTLANMTGDGATGWTGTDNTAAFQAAIDAAAAGTNGVSKTVYVPYGVYMSGPLDFSGAGGITFLGDGAVIIPNAFAHNKHFFDLGDAGRIRFVDIVVGSYVQSLNITPKTIVFMGQSASGSGNAHYWKGSSFIGRCSVAVVYNYGHASSKAIDCFFQGYGNGVPVCYWSATNAASQTSDNITVTTGLSSTTDWSFLHCEFHEEAAERNEWYAPDAIYETSTAWIWEFEGAADIRFYGGNMGANGTRYVRFTDTGAAFTCKSIRFDGISFYAQDPAGVTVPTGFEVAASSTVEDLIISGASRVDATTDVIKLGSGAALTRPIVGPLKIYGSAPDLVDMASGSGTITDGDLICQGLNVKLGASGALTRGRLVYPSTVTASTNSAQAIQSDGSLSLRGGYINIGATVASAGAIRGENNTSWRQRNAANSADLVMASSDASNNLSFGNSSGTIGTITIGQSANSGVVTVHSAAAINLAFGGTTRIATSSVGGTVTGVMNATTALSVGATPATVGAVRLSNNDSMIYRNGANSGDIIVMNMDGSNNLNFGSTSGMGTTQFRSTSGISMTTTSGQIEAGTGALATNATAGHFCIPSCPGAATGAASPTSGMIPIVYDSTNHKIYALSGGTWRSTAALT